MGFVYQEMSHVESGPIRSVIKAYGSALNVFKIKEQNDICRMALVNAGYMWCYVFLPKRFTDYVLGSPFNYNCGGRYDSWKLRNTGQNLPNVVTGEARRFAIEANRVEARSTRNKSVILIKMPMPSNGAGYVYANSPKNQLGKMLRTVPPREIKRIGEWFEKALAALMENRKAELGDKPQGALRNRASNQGEPRKRGRPPGRQRKVAA
jgi:hypothetical protein